MSLGRRYTTPHSDHRSDTVTVTITGSINIDCYLFSFANNSNLYSSSVHSSCNSLLLFFISFCKKKILIFLTTILHLLLFPSLLLMLNLEFCVSPPSTFVKWLFSSHFHRWHFSVECHPYHPPPPQKKKKKSYSVADLSLTLNGCRARNHESCLAVR